MVSGLKQLTLAWTMSLAFCCTTGSCASALQPWDDVNNPSDDVALTRCRKEGRAALDGGSKETAYAAYVACTKDAGLR